MKAPSRRSKFASTRALLLEAGLAKSGEEAHRLARANREFTIGYYTRLPLIASHSWRARRHRQTEARGDFAAFACAPAVFVTAHLGEFEYGASYLHDVHGVRLAVPVRTISPRRRHDAMNSIRRKSGLVPIPCDGSFGHLVEALNEGLSTVITVDRRPATRGIEIEMFGRRATVSAAPVLLSELTGAPVIPVATWNTARGVICSVGEAIWPTRNNLSQALVMRAVLRFLGSAIRQAPEQWHVPADLSQMCCSFEPGLGLRR